MKKRWLAILMAVMMAISLLPTAAWAEDVDGGAADSAGTSTGETTGSEGSGSTEGEGEGETIALDVSRSKTATQLDKSTWTSNVTLSLPSAEEALASDIVFVLDTSDCVGSVMTQVSELVDQLKSAQEKTKADIKVGVVAFKGSALPMFDGKLVSVKDAEATLTKMAEEVSNADGASAKEAVVLRYLNADTDFINKGSNLHSGLLGAQALLKKDTAVADSRKYVVTVTDGMTYYWNDSENNVYGIYSGSNANGTAYPSLLFYAWCEAHNISMSNPDLYQLPKDFEGWDSYLKKAKALEEKDNGKYTVNVREMKDKLGGNFSSVRFSTIDALTSHNIPYIPAENETEHAHGMDYSVTACLDTYQEMLDAGYQCYTLNPDYGTNTFPGLFTSELNEMANKTVIDFGSIQNDILYAVSAGSEVTDTIGDKFTFGGVDSFVLTVGGSKIEGTPDAADANTVNFGDVKDDGTYPYTITYTPATKTFVWTINENVSNFAPVQLSYTVKLSKPETAAGTYGVTDLNGDTIVDGTEDDAVVPENALYTNDYAKLTPKDSTGQTGETLDFPKPSVSYTVRSSGGGGGGGGSSRPTLNTEDHFGYIIGYPVDYFTGEPTTDQTRKPVRPQGEITRAEVATIFFRMLTDESRTQYWSQSNDYSDVEQGQWFNAAVSTLSKAGIISGYPDGSFRPNGSITRAEFATIAVRFFDVQYDGAHLFPDIDGHWAQDYIDQAGSAGLVNGYPDGTFGPDRSITRAEAVTLVNRTLDRHPDPEHFLKDMLVWPDNMDTTAWYYADMQEATNSHQYEMKTDSDKTKYEVWTKMLPIRDWEAFEKAWSDAGSASNPGEVVNK